MEEEVTLSLNDSEKLVALQEVDQYRRWNALDDKRRCLRCGQLITGREIRIVLDETGDGPLRGRCPTKECASIPMDWALPRSAEMVIPGADEVAVQFPFLAA